MPNRKLSQISDGQLNRLFLRQSIIKMIGATSKDPELCNEDSYLYKFSKSEFYGSDDSEECIEC